MSHFIFKAKKAGGEVHKGEQDAKDRFELYRILKESGEELISAEEKSGARIKRDIPLPFLNRIKQQDKINFARSLGSMIKAGLSLSQALTVMERQGRNPVIRRIVATVNADVRKGKTLSESMASFKKMFPPLMIAMVSAGEQSGGLSEALGIVTLQMDKSYSLGRRIRGALMYPAVIFCAIIIIAAILLTFVVPTLIKTFTELNVALPLSTRVVIWISDIVKNEFLSAAGALAAIIALIYMWVKRGSGKPVLHRVTLKIPLLGQLVQEVNVARTARTLSSLIAAGVDVLESLRITADVVQNVHYKNVLVEARRAVEKGAPLSKVFSENEDLYPPFLSQMITVGEETGKIDEMMVGVANYYEDDVDQKTKDISTVLEPLIMIIVAAAVGFFAVAMISPMYSLVNTI